MRVQAGAEYCSPIGPLEKDGIAALHAPAGDMVRLACQRTVTDDGVQVFKRGVRPWS